MVLSCPVLAVSSVELIPFPIATTLSSSAVSVEGKLALPICMLASPFTHSPDPLPTAMFPLPVILF